MHLFRIIITYTIPTKVTAWAARHAELHCDVF